MRVERASNGRLPTIDGLRALAVLGILAHHAFYALPVADAARFAPWLAYVSLSGTHGAYLFFVISGFGRSNPFLRQLRGSKVAALDLPRDISRDPPYYTATVLFTRAYFALRAAHIGLFFLNWQTESRRGGTCTFRSRC